MDIKVFNVALLVGWLLILGGGVLIHVGWGLAVAGAALVLLTLFGAYFAGLRQSGADKAD